MGEPTPPGEGAGFNDLVGLVEESVADGRSTITMVAGERHLNPAGTVHGGAIATLIDVAMGKAMASLISDDEHPVTIEMKVNFLEAGEPGHPGGRGQRQPPRPAVHRGARRGHPARERRDRRRGRRDLHQPLSAAGTYDPRPMAHVLIIHDVADYPAWKDVFDAAAGIRRAAGERSYRVLRDADRPGADRPPLGVDLAHRGAGLLRVAPARRDSREGRGERPRVPLPRRAGVGRPLNPCAR